MSSESQEQSSSSDTTETMEPQDSKGKGVAIVNESVVSFPSPTCEFLLVLNISNIF